MAYVVTGLAVSKARAILLLYLEPRLSLGRGLLRFLSPEDLPGADSPAPSVAAVPVATPVLLTRSANPRLLFAINQARLLRCTTASRVWRAVLCGVLVAGLATSAPFASSVIRVRWRLWERDATTWGNVAFVYLGARVRSASLSAV